MFYVHDPWPPHPLVFTSPSIRKLKSRTPKEFWKVMQPGTVKLAFTLDLLTQRLSCLTWHWSQTNWLWGFCKGLRRLETQIGLKLVIFLPPSLGAWMREAPHPVPSFLFLWEICKTGRRQIGKDIHAKAYVNINLHNTAISVDDKSSRIRTETEQLVDRVCFPQSAFVILSDLIKGKASAWFIFSKNYFASPGLNPRSCTLPQATSPH